MCDLKQFNEGLQIGTKPTRTEMTFQEQNQTLGSLFLSLLILMRLLLLDHT